jgi:phosphatidate cytidylyltransferase
MIRTRIAVGTLLALAAVGVLVADQWLAPWFPFLLAFLLFVGMIGARELVRLFPAAIRPHDPLAACGVLGIVVANFALPFADSGSRLIGMVLVFTALFLIAFLYEMARYREPGTAIPRLALTTFMFVYLGVLGSFFAQIRWLADPARTSVMLVLTIFVPKAGDVGAYFAGTFLGRHKMTPILSPKKTWEGFAGGMLAAMAVAVGLSFTGNVFRYGILEAAAFGLVIGVAGVLGDLAESLIKRDCQAKDAAQSIPGFGGLLDVVDSVLFAAPVAYVWFRFS